jgi:hypothetical protein
LDFVSLGAKSKKETVETININGIDETLIFRQGNY